MRKNIKQNKCWALGSDISESLAAVAGCRGYANQKHLATCVEDAGIPLNERIYMDLPFRRLL